MHRKKKEKIINVPNLLSVYRLLSFPLLLWLIARKNEHLFALLFCINLVTDILDGLIARLFNMRTELGARLDSLADIGMYILAFAGVYAFREKELGAYIIVFWIFAGMWIAGNLYAILKFGKFPSLHLYSVKVSGYLQGIFFFILFSYGFIEWLFLTVLLAGIFSWLEEIIVLTMLKELRSDVKGMRWLRKSEGK